MNNTLLAGLVLSTWSLAACSSNEVAQKKSAFSQCVKENKGDEELCASKESVEGMQRRGQATSQQ